MPRATACEAMCRPSASNAIEPNKIPAAISTTIIVAVIAIVGAAVYQRRGRVAVDKRVFFWTWFMTLVGLFFVLLGVVRGHPGAMTVSTVYVVWPWLYLVFVAGVSHEAILRGLLRVMGWALLAIDLYALQYILYSAGIWPASLYLELDLGQAISFFEGSVEFNLYNISSLLFLIPFAVAALMVWPPPGEPGGASPPIRRGLLWATVLLGVVVALLSGRRALLLCVALTPAVVFPLQFLTPASERRLGTRQAFYALAGFVVVVCGEAEPGQRGGAIRVSHRRPP